ncbi:MAG: hypothetical protein EOP48_01130 [Sphingobacteriales bacterium]|nr:MAG: hypothetical protein EOP48_01130 [Sphingobacteriales bacterium]
MNTYLPFDKFYDEVIEPLAKDNPGWKRVDGNEANGNRTPVGYFEHDGTIWRVNSDSRFEPLKKARTAFAAGNNPFVRRTNCLDLVPELATRPKHLYIYPVRQK